MFCRSPQRLMNWVMCSTEKFCTEMSAIHLDSERASWTEAFLRLET
jgi:hypothetical protein